MQAGCCKSENAYDKAAQHLAHALGDSVAGGNPGIPYAAPAASQAAPPTLQPPRRLTGPYLKRSGFENENRFDSVHEAWKWAGLQNADFRATESGSAVSNITVRNTSKKPPVPSASSSDVSLVQIHLSIIPSMLRPLPCALRFSAKPTRGPAPGAHVLEPLHLTPDL